MNSLPSDWQLKSLKEVATLQRGFDLPVNDRIEGDIPVFAANGPVGTHNVAKVKSPGVVTGRSGTLGKVHLVTTDYWPLNTALWVKDFHGNDPNWVFRLLSWMKLENHTRGTGVPTLNRNLVHVVEVPLPPLEEQRRIAAILDKADAIRRKRKQAIQYTEELLRSTFLEMFGDPVANPKGWEIIELGEELAFLTSGSRGWAKYYSDQGERFIRSLDVKMNHIADDDAVFVNAPSNAESKRTRVKDGDVLLTITGSRIGRVASVPKEFGTAYISQHVAILRLKEQLSPQYLSFFLSLPKGGQHQIERMQYGQTKPGLNLSQINNFQILLPPIERQNAFNNFWAHHKETINKQLTSLRETDNLFNSLLQRAFKGKL